LRRRDVNILHDVSSFWFSLRIRDGPHDVLPTEKKWPELQERYSCRFTEATSAAACSD
jgi:hypothetical protein